VLSYAAFVDVGVCKDGMLHVSDVKWLVGSFVSDLREYVKVGDKLTLLYVAEVDEANQRFTLTSKPPAPTVQTPTRSAPLRSASQTTAALGYDTRCSQSTEVHAAPSRFGASRFQQAGGGKMTPPEAEAEAFPALTRADAGVGTTAGEAEATLKPVHAGGAPLHEIEMAPLQPSAASIVKGAESAPTPPPAPTKLRVIAWAQIRGKVHVLYDLDEVARAL